MTVTVPVTDFGTFERIVAAEDIAPPCEVRQFWGGHDEAATHWVTVRTHECRPFLAPKTSLLCTEHYSQFMEPDTWCNCPNCHAHIRCLEYVIDHGKL